MGVIRQYDSPEKNADAKAQIKSILKKALTQEPLPQKIVGRLLTNGQHWQLVVIDLSEGLQNPKLQIINSTNLTSKMPLDQIQGDYYNIFGATLNETLAELGGTPIQQQDIQYMQGLQYGNMGCGFTADLNYKHMQAGGFAGDSVFNLVISLQQLNTSKSRWEMRLFHSL